MQYNFGMTQTVSDQIIHDIYNKVASGKIRTGEKLPSIREMASQWSVSPDTVQRAYSQLEQTSLITTKRGLGTFINDDENWINHFRTSLMFKKMDAFIKEIKEIGFSIDSVVAYLKARYSKEEELCIENAQDAKEFLVEFEKYSEIDENGHYSITFRNDVDYLHEVVWTTLFKSEDKWYFFSHGENWMPLKAKEMPKIVPFVLKYSKSIIEAVSKKEDHESAFE